MSATFVYATANMQGTDSVAEIQATVKGVAKNTAADVIGWQEAPTGHVMEVLEALGPDWEHSRLTEVPISWRKDVFSFVDSTNVRVHGGELGITPTRYIHTVVLKHVATDEEISFVNTHVVHHIEAGGLPRKYKGDPRKKGTEAYRYRDQLARAKKHFALLRDAIVGAQAETQVVIWGGDLNVSFYADKAKAAAAKACVWFPYTVLSGVTEFDPAPDGTEGGRMIDWVGHVGPVERVQLRKVAKGASDHNPVAVTFKTTRVMREPSRGKAVEAALEALHEATPSKTNAPKIAQAIAVLESIAPA